MLFYVPNFAKYGSRISINTLLTVEEVNLMLFTSICEFLSILVLAFAFRPSREYPENYRGGLYDSSLFKEALNSVEETDQNLTEENLDQHDGIN